MKKWMIMSLMLIATTAQAQKINYEELMEIDGITSVYVSEAMLKLMPEETMKVANVNNVDFNNLTKGIKEIYIFTTENASKKKFLKKVFSNQDKDTNIEMLMSVKDDDSRVKMFAYKKGKKVKGIYLHAEEENEFTVISILGDFLMEDIQTTISGVNK